MSFNDKEAMEYLRISDNTLREAIVEGQLKASMYCMRWMFRNKWLDRFIKEGARGGKKMEAGKKICQNCLGKFDKTDLYCVHDRYGIPYKLVCEKCVPKVKKESACFVFDEAYAGEKLEDDH